MKKIIRTAIAAFSVCAAAASVSAQELQDFSYLVPLKMDGKGPLHEVTLTPEAYAAITRRDLGDLRVFNGAGELVPYAVMRVSESQTQERPVVALPFFPLRGSTYQKAGELQVRVDKRKDGSLSTVVSSSQGAETIDAIRGYLIDASKLKEAITGLRFGWAESGQGSETWVMVEASDDLSKWRSLVPASPLMRLRYGESLLEHNKVALPATRAKYFRVSWADKGTPLEFNSVSASLPLHVKEPERQWSRQIGREGKNAGEYLFEASAAAPVDRARVELADPNAIVPMTLAIRDREGDKWRGVKALIVCGVWAQSSGFDTSTTIVQDSARYWMAKADPRRGGVIKGEVVLHLGWVPDRIVFNARGDGPFTLAVGNSQMSGAAMPVQTLVPGYGTPQAHTLRRAKLEIVAANPQSRVEHKVAERLGIKDEVDAKRIMLWGALVAAVAAIGYMALRLMRQLPQEPPQ